MKAERRTCKLDFRPVSERTKDDFVRLFDRPGWQRQCWCMVWRATKEEGRGTASAIRREQMLGRIDRGVPTGLLGYDGEEPVAWVSIAPKGTYQGLGGPDPAEGEVVWSLACMLIRRDYRGAGLAHELIAAAVDHAKRNGATTVEAYPVRRIRRAIDIWGSYPLSSGRVSWLWGWREPAVMSCDCCSDAHGPSGPTFPGDG